MRIHKLKVVLIAASILALGAGVFAGMAVSRLPISGPTGSAPVPADKPSIADELHLTDAQRDQMRTIWEGVRSDVHDTLDRAQTIQRDRDAAVVAMLTDSQKAKYAALTQEAAEKFAALGAQRDQAFHDGVDKTRKILNDAQRETYDRIIRDRVGAGSEGAFSGIGQAAPTTEPAGR
jgi:Spy/CpxP family protein refolding chaperone